MLADDWTWELVFAIFAIFTIFAIFHFFMFFLLFFTVFRVVGLFSLFVFQLGVKFAIICTNFHQISILYDPNLIFYWLFIDFNCFHMFSLSKITFSWSNHIYGWSQIYISSFCDYQKLQKNDHCLIFHNIKNFLHFVGSDFAYFAIFRCFRWFLPPQSRTSQYEKPKFHKIILDFDLIFEDFIFETQKLEQRRYSS